MANVFDLSGISTMGSAGFLLIFAVVNFANVRLYKQTQSYRWVSGLGAVAAISAVVVLLSQAARTQPQNLWIVIIMIAVAFGIEGLYRQFKGRSIHLRSVHHRHRP